MRLTVLLSLDAEESGKGDEEKVPTPAPLFHIEFDQVDLVCLAMASVVGVWWICTKVSAIAACSEVD